MSTAERTILLDDDSDTDNDDVIFVDEVAPKSGNNFSSAGIKRRKLAESVNSDALPKQAANKVSITALSELNDKKIKVSANVTSWEFSELFSNRQKELDALIAHYGPSSSHHPWGVQFTSTAAGNGKNAEISLNVIPHLSSPFSLVMQSKVRKEVSLGNLRCFPAVRMTARYASDSMPTLDVKCCWLSNDLIKNLSEKLHQQLKRRKSLHSAIKWLESDGVIDIGILMNSAIHLVDSVALKTKPSSIILAGQNWETVLASFRLVNHKAELFIGTSLEKAKVLNCPLCDHKVPAMSAVIFEKCRHLFCQECVGLDFKSKIRRKDMKRLTCLADGCLTVADDIMISELFDKATYNQYCERISEVFLLENPLMVKCPKSQCGTTMELPSHDVPYDIRCVTCSYLFCSRCSNARHAQFPCLTNGSVCAPVAVLTEEEKHTVFQKFIAQRTVRQVAAGFHDQIVIPENSTGYGFGKLFERCLDGSVTTVEIDDPFIQTVYQISRFLEFCSAVAKITPNLRTVSLRTRTSPNAQEQESKLRMIGAGFSTRNLTLYVRKDQNLHDREIRFDNGWMVKIGRGLDYFQRFDSHNCLGAVDLDFRKCLHTTIDYYYKPKNQPKVPIYFPDK